MLLLYSSPLLNSGCNHDTLLTPGGGGGLRIWAVETPAGSSQAAERGEAVCSSLSPPGPGKAGCAGAREKTTQRNPREEPGVCRLLLAPPTQTLIRLLFQVGLVRNPIFLHWLKVGSRKTTGSFLPPVLAWWLKESCYP